MNKAQGLVAALLAVLTLTGSGCGGGGYCPGNTITRAQMAVFLLRAEHDAGYVPPAPDDQARIGLDHGCPDFARFLGPI